MKEDNKMYSMEVVQNAIYATAIGFSGNLKDLEEILFKLPEEIQVEVLTSILAAQTSKAISNAAKGNLLKDSLEEIAKIINSTEDNIKKAPTKEDK